MDKKQAIAFFVVFGAIFGAIVFFTHQTTTPASQDEFNAIDNWLSELDDFLDFENQTFDFDLGEISGDWG